MYSAGDGITNQKHFLLKNGLVIFNRSGKAYNFYSQKSGNIKVSSSARLNSY